MFFCLLSLLFVSTTIARIRTPTSPAYMTTPARTWTPTLISYPTTTVRTWTPTLIPYPTTPATPTGLCLRFSRSTCLLNLDFYSASKMDDNVPSRYGSTESHNPAYHKDQVRCIVPTCGKWRRSHPELHFFCVPNTLKDTWCSALNRNCPRRPLFVCEVHINKEQDCYRSATGKLLLKPTANLRLTTTFYEPVPTVEKEHQEENFRVETIQHKDNITKCDIAIQVQSDMKNQGILVKPSTRSRGQNINILNMDKPVMPSQAEHFTERSSSFSSVSQNSTHSIYEPSTSSQSTICQEDDGRNYMLKIIERDPKTYIGVPNNFFWIISFLAKECSLKQLHIIITLFKIKQDDTMKRIGDHFNLEKSSIIKIFQKTLPILATYFQNLIYLPAKLQIKKMLPPVFKPRYSNVQCIIDCFEVEIEKPSDPIRQAQTWSQYKSCNTIKYLIACCPNGFVCFVSRGFGGRISDKAITECSGFMDILPPNSAILADRGFKGIEAALSKNKVTLLRPPSVTSADKPSKLEVIKSKVIASLRVHVERVIRRVREFYFLKPHSCVNHNHVFYLDECVIVACALINLQGDIIKSI